MAKKEQVVEYTIRMTKAHSDELAKMSVADGEDNELVWLEDMAISVIEEKQFFREGEPFYVPEQLKLNQTEIIEYAEQNNLQMDFKL